MPGSGYGGEYYANHSNETAPTSPSVSGGSANIQEASLPSTGCDSSQIDNAQDMAPANPASGDAPGADSVPGADSAPGADSVPGADSAGSGVSETGQK